MILDMLHALLALSGAAFVLLMVVGLMRRNVALLVLAAVLAAGGFGFAIGNVVLA